MQTLPVHLTLPLALALAMAAAVDAQPWERHVIDADSRGADGVRLADFDADGDLDIVTAWEEGNVVRVCINPGPAAVRQRWQVVTVGSIKTGEDAVIVDVDGDGAADVLSAAEGGTRTMYLHWGPRDPAARLESDAWRAEAISATAGRTMWMFTLPMPAGDGRAQPPAFYITGSKTASASIGLLRPGADPRRLEAWTWRKLRDAGWIMSLAAHDMNGDGALDVVYTDRRGPQRGVGWLENPGPDQPDAPWADHPIGGSEHEVMFLDVGDLDGDAHLDIVVAAKGQRVLWFERGPDGAWREQRIVVDANAGTAKAAHIADVNGDGRADLVYTCEKAGGERRGVLWLERQGERWITHDISGPAGTKFDLAATIDLDGDGDLEVITCEETENLGVIWYENGGR